MMRFTPKACPVLLWRIGRSNGYAPAILRFKRGCAILNPERSYASALGLRGATLARRGRQVANSVSQSPIPRQDGRFVFYHWSPL